MTSPAATPGRPKLCYLLPSYDPDTEEHFFHVYRFLEALTQELDLTVVIERCKGTPSFGGTSSVRIQRWTSFFPLRVLEIVWLFLALRIQGHRIFYVHYSYFGGIFWSLLARLTGARVHYWHCISRTFSAPAGLSRAHLRHKVKAEIPLEVTMRLIGSLVTGTHGVAEFYRERFGIPAERIIVLPNEVDLRRFELSADTRAVTRQRLGLGPAAPVVLFLHRVVESKGAHLLPGIARRVLAGRPDAVFLVVGSGPCAAQLAERLNGEGLSSSFRLTGWVPNRDVPPLYAASDLYLMPSLEEGFPRAMLEAMASGIPSVASDVGGVREILPPEMTPYVAAIGDEETFARLVLQLLADPALRHRLGEACRTAAAAYDLPRVKERFLETVVGLRGHGTRPR